VKASFRRQVSGVLSHRCSGTGFLQGGLGWYRKSFTLPPSMSGKRISAEFDGVYMDSYVYFNGRQVGNHPYGYTGFDVDLTGLAHTDGTTPNVLTVTDPVHVQRHGVFVTTPGLEKTVTSGYADVHVQTAVANAGGPRRSPSSPGSRTPGEGWWRRFRSSAADAHATPAPPGCVRREQDTGPMV
jgi:hypothetical protein